jgi:hypothetical protein
VVVPEDTRRGNRVPGGRRFGDWIKVAPGDYVSYQTRPRRHHPWEPVAPDFPLASILWACRLSPLFFPATPAAAA